MNEYSNLELVDDTFIRCVATIVSAYISNNKVAADDLPALVSETYLALTALQKPLPLSLETSRAPAVPVSKSVTRDHIVCLEDGKKFRTLKRHLGRLGMTPQEYRKKWDLPSDYPLVAPSYSAKRSTLAKSSGLGRHRVAVSDASTESPGAHLEGPMMLSPCFQTSATFAEGESCSWR